MKPSPTRAALWLAVTVALALPVAAQDWRAAPETKAPTAAQQKELDAARARLDAAAKRYGELARQYGVEASRYRVEQRLLRKPVIGVVLAPDEAAGVRIAGVTPGSAADEAGVKSGDRIVAVDGKAIAGADAEARLDAARDAMGRHGEKSEMKLRLAREGKERVVALAPRAGDRLMFYGVDSDFALDQARAAAEAAHAAIPAAREAAAQARVARAEALHARGEAMAAAREAVRVAAIAPDVRREIVMMNPGEACSGEHCKLPVIADALRWNGLNLASLGASLGRYFGSDDGVLVVSTGPELEGLQAGDVIRSIDGKAVQSPRDVMEALRGRDAGSKVAVGYLRDRKAGNTQVTVPEPMMFRIPAPPAPPAPPAAPAPPAPPMAPRAPGLVAPAPPAPPPPSLPVD
jgi:hypothetical protein